MLDTLQKDDGGDYMCPSCKTGTVLDPYGNATICPCLMYNMRDATKEEQDGVNNYIKSISTPTGILFESPYIDKEELDKIVVKLNAIGNINPV